MFFRKKHAETKASPQPSSLVKETIAAQEKIKASARSQNRASTGTPESKRSVSSSGAPAAKPNADGAKSPQVLDGMLALGRIVSVLMRTAQFRTLTLADLEALVVPALLNNQFAVASTSTTNNGLLSPAAIALWALVSPEVDQRLSKNLDQPFRLSSGEWKSGEIPWLIATAGDPKGVDIILKQVQENRLQGKTFKVRGKKKDGTEVVGQLGARQAQKH